MSRSHYSDDYDARELNLYRGQVSAAIRGKRGQKLLRDLRDALEAMPSKRLIANELESAGEVCALGAVGRVRGVDMSRLDPEEPDQVAHTFDIASQLAREVVFENDESRSRRYEQRPDGSYGWRDETPEERWERMHAWACGNIVQDTSEE